ncbi:MAG: hypothetical protein ABIO39_08915 [Caulobacteraceae bacterium]
MSALEKGLKVDPWRVDPMRTPYAGQDRRYRALLRSLVNLGDRVEFDVGVRAVGRANSFNVPAYADADVRIGYHLTTALDLSLSGFSLLHNSHMEAIDPSSAPVVPVQRAVLLSLRWRR